MNVSVEKLGACKVLLRFEVDAAAVDTAFARATADYQKQARLTGFRPGKAPAHLVTRAYGADIEREVKRRLVAEHYKQAVDREKLRPLGNPDIEEIQFARGQGFQFAATLETEPELTLLDYKGLPVEVETRTVTDADVERAVTVLREQRAAYNDVARAAQPGDVVVVNYRGTCEGRPITDHAPTARGLTEQKNFWLKIEPGHFIPGFTEQLAGASAGDRRTVTVTFPADFVAPTVAGKEGVYEVEVVGVKEKLLPELNEEFVKQFGVETVEKLHEGVRQNLGNEAKFRRLSAIRNQLVKHLLDRVTCDLPDSLVQHETRNVVYDIVRTNQERGVPKEALSEKKDEIFSAANTSAKDRVKAAIILHRIADHEQITVSEQEMTNRILAIAQQKQEDPNKVAKELQKNNQLPAIHEQLLTAKVLDFLQLHALVTETPARA